MFLISLETPCFYLEHHQTIFLDPFIRPKTQNEEILNFLTKAWVNPPGKIRILARLDSDIFIFKKLPIPKYKRNLKLLSKIID